MLCCLLGGAERAAADLRMADAVRAERAAADLRIAEAVRAERAAARLDEHRSISNMFADKKTMLAMVKYASFSRSNTSDSKCDSLMGSFN